jgi:hypothetical protein
MALLQPYYWGPKERDESARKRVPEKLSDIFPKPVSATRDIGALKSRQQPLMDETLATQSYNQALPNVSLSQNTR